MFLSDDASMVHGPAVDRRTMVAVMAGLTALPWRGALAAPTDGGGFDLTVASQKIAFDRIGHGEKVLLISGFPQTRRSWSRLIPFLASKYETVPADLPGFGDSGLLGAPATTETVGKVLHVFTGNLGAPLHVVAHDVGAWCAYSWALQFPQDFKSLTLIDAGIPSVTLTDEMKLSDYKRKWNFVFQMLPDLPAELTRGKEDVYAGWWFKNKVYRPGAIASGDAAAYIHAYSREGRMDAAFDYFRNIEEDMRFNKSQFHAKLPIRLLAVGGDHSIPEMGNLLEPYFRDVTSSTIKDSGHFVPEEQPEALAKALLAFLQP